MIKKNARLVLTILGALLGLGVVNELLDFFVGIKLISPDHAETFPWISLTAYVLGVGVFAVLSYFFSLPVSMAFIRLMRWVESKLSKVPMIDMIFGCAGLLIGLLIAFLITFMFMSVYSKWIYTVLGIVIYVLLGYLGTTIGVKRWRELNFSWVRRLQQQTEKNNAIPEHKSAVIKVLDTSVIIDGRIFDLCKTGFIEGTLVIPNFVLKELRHISDSADPLKRNRGRRGLDVLARIQKELNMEVRIDEHDFDDTDEVDVKLLKLAKLRGGCVVTNDYNLNKVADVSGIRVLNLNDLANALKPVVLPGEEMSVQILREGKEANQGVAYLDDGTMIVVESGRKFIGETILVTVTSVLQTSAGRMIFAKPCDSIPTQKEQ